MIPDDESLPLLIEPAAELPDNSGCKSSDEHRTISLGDELPDQAHIKPPRNPLESLTY